MMDNQDKYKSIQEEIEQIERDTQSMHQSISGLETGLQDMVSKHSKIDIMIEHQLTHLNETYQLTFEKHNHCMKCQKIFQKQEKQLN